MQTQKDHVEAHSFLVGRMTSALVTGDDSFSEVPARRAWKGLIIGAVLAVLCVAGFFVFGLIVPAHKDTGTTPRANVTGISSPQPSSVNRELNSLRVNDYPVEPGRSLHTGIKEG